MDNYFEQFRIGTLFLIREPRTFPEGYADQCFADMKKLHMDYAAWLETWNCYDGTIWPSDQYPRSSYWKDSPRDPLEETLLAADRHQIDFFPEAGVMDNDFIMAHKDQGICDPQGNFLRRHGRLGLPPACPLTLDYFIEKYDALIGRCRQHPSFRGVCLPCEGTLQLSYDKNTREQFRKASGREVPPEHDLYHDQTLREELTAFLEQSFIAFFEKLAKHIKQKYHLPLMQYPYNSNTEVNLTSRRYLYPFPGACLSTACKITGNDCINYQIHPPLNDNVFHFKLDADMLQGVCGNRPNVADTHFYIELTRGKLPVSTPKRYIDSILSTLTPFGVSFFCYGFMAPKLPLWKDELNPGSKVFNAYTDPETTAVRRANVIKGLDYAASLKPLLSRTLHAAECGIYWQEQFNTDHLTTAYCNDHLYGLHEALQATSIPTVVTTRIPDNASTQKVLVFDAVKKVHGDELSRLEKFLAAGGKAVLIGRCMPELCRLCGMEPSETDADYVLDEDGEWYFGIQDGRRAYTEKNGRCILRYNTGEAAATVTSRGLFLGCQSVFDEFSTGRPFGVVQLLRRLLNDLDAVSGIHANFSFCRTQGGHTFAPCDLFATADGSRKVLLVRNFGVEIMQGSIRWDLPHNFRITRSITENGDFHWEQDAPLPVFEHFLAIEATRQ